MAGVVVQSLTLKRKALYDLLSVSSGYFDLRPSWLDEGVLHRSMGELPMSCIQHHLHWNQHFFHRYFEDHINNHHLLLDASNEGYDCFDNIPSIHHAASILESHRINVGDVHAFFQYIVFDSLHWKTPLPYNDHIPMRHYLHSLLCHGLSDFFQ